MTSRRLGARDDRRHSIAMVGCRPADEPVSGSSGRKTPSLGGDGVLPCLEQRRHKGRFGLRRYDGSVIHLRLRSVLSLCLVSAVAAGLAACGSTPPSTTPRVSASPAASAGPSVQASTGPAAGQTDTAWGRIWDSLPAGFPAIPGSTPSEEAATGPASATLAVEGVDAKTIATTLKTQLEAAGFTTEGLNGPAEDGGYVLESTGTPAGCQVQATVSPLGGLTLVTILYGAACPNG